MDASCDYKFLSIETIVSPVSRAASGDQVQRRPGAVDEVMRAVVNG